MMKEDRRPSDARSKTGAKRSENAELSLDAPRRLHHNGSAGLVIGHAASWRQTRARIRLLWASELRRSHFGPSCVHLPSRLLLPRSIAELRERLRWELSVSEGFDGMMGTVIFAARCAEPSQISGTFPRGDP